MMAGERDIASPRRLSEFLRSNTPRWLSKLLKIKFDDVTLDDLFANCWVLGRVADTAQGLMNGIPYHSPSPQLSDRPPSAARSDFEKFSAVCDTLGVDPVTRVTLDEVQSRTAGERIALCLWDVADALRRRGYETVPEFAPAEDFVQLKRSESEGSGVGGADSFSSPPPARKSLPVIPLLPLDTSPAIQKQRARAALPLSPPDKKHKSKSKKPAPTEGEKEKSSGNGAASSSDVVAAPPAKSMEQQQATPTAEVVSAATPPPVPPQPAPPSSSSTPAAPPPAPAPAAEPADHSAGSTDILAAILSPEKNKPVHTQVLNALMRSEDSGSEPEAPTTAPGDGSTDARGKRSLGLVMDAPGSRESSGRGGSRQGDPSLVRVMGSKGANSPGGDKRRRRSNGGWRLPGVLAILGAVAALAVALSTGKSGKKKEEEEVQQVERRQGGGWQPLRHAGRW